MGCARTRHVREQILLEEDNDLLFESIKRQEFPRLVGEAQITITPEMKALEEFRLCHNKHNRITYKEYKRMLFRLNANIPRKVRRIAFHALDADGDGELTEREFATCFSNLDQRTQMRKVFDECDVLRNNALSAEALFDFYQRSAPRDDISGWRPPTLDEVKQLLRGDFLDYHDFRTLLSDAKYNHVCSPERVFGVYQDMTQPLSHYYINSSHNTYLNGSQTKSNSTPVAIRRALKLGTRVVELDVWDGKQEPIVNHGHTMCRPTTFERCIRAIADTAFLASPFPVILTIENHCTKGYQEMMAATLHHVLGDKLYKFHADGEELDSDALLRGPAEWASPLQLQYKVIIRDKPKRLHVRKTQAELDAAAAAAALKKKKSSFSRRTTTASTSAPLSTDVDASHHHRRDVISSFIQAPSASEPKLVGAATHNNNAQQLKKTKVERKHTDLLDSDSEEEDDAPVDETWFVDAEDENEGMGEEEDDHGNRSKLEFKFASFRKRLQNESFHHFPHKMSQRHQLLRQQLKREQAGASSPQYATASAATATTASVPQLLEITYIKNVKLRVKEAGRRRTTMRAGAGAGAIPEKDYSNIHFTYPPWRSSSSVPEGRMIKLVKPGQRAAGLSTYALEHLIRCYPAGSRVDSSNYDPCPAWNAGIQIVALNFQTNGRVMWLNQGKFLDNGACGYVLKPAKMLTARACGKSTAPAETGTGGAFWDLSFNALEERADRLTITVLSAHWLPKPMGASLQRSEIIDPFVEITIAGFEPDAAQVKTRWIRDNGFDPQFDEMFEFNLRRSELDLVLFVVKDKDSYGEDFIGQNAFPANLLRPGYRVLPLKRADSTPLPDAFLFVHIRWERDAVALRGDVREDRLHLEESTKSLINFNATT